MSGVCGSCGSNRGHIEGRCRNCGGPFTPHRQYEQVFFEGMSVMVGRDDDGDVFVSINTENAKAGVNNDDGDPQVWVYLNDATLHDPEEFAVEKERMLQEQDEQHAAQ